MMSVVKIGSQLYYSTLFRRIGSKGSHGIINDYRVYAFNCKDKKDILLIRPNIIKKILDQYRLV